MNLITLLSDGDFDPKLSTPNRSGYSVRKAGRAVLTNQKDEVALMWLGKYSIYKLPGGGIEEYEDLHEGLKREILEETGCHASIGDEIGLTLEFRDDWKLLQISYCYKAVVTEDTGKLKLTADEKEDKFALKWVSLPKAIPLVTKTHTPFEYDPKFMQRRDLSILQYALQHP